MKKLLYLLLICILFQSGFCVKKCDSYIEAPIRGPIEEYFGVYKPGNWWIYKNTSGTKKDSIYVEDFIENIAGSREACLKAEERMFTLKNSILMNGNNLYVISSSEKTAVDINFSLIKYQTQSGGFPQFIYNEDENKLSSFPQLDNLGQNIFDSVTLNNVTYRNILQGKYDNNVYYFSKNRGLIGWTSNGETFNLVSYKIQ